MPYYRKLTHEEQAEVDKHMRKCWSFILGGFAIVGIILYMVCDYI